jgi:D-amino-acid dehydrogenase
MTETRDIIVLGAGIVGTSTALQLQRRGRRVTLVDRREPGEETSFGNAGVVEGGTYVPISFPRNPLTILRYATNRESSLHFHWSFLPRIIPWLYTLFRNSSPACLKKNGAAIMTLTAHAIEEHRSLLTEAGVEALMRDNGWLRVYRSEAELGAEELEMRLADESGFSYRVLDAVEVREIEPHVQPAFHKAVHWPAVSSVSDPGAATKAVAKLFKDAGGEIVRGEVRRMAPENGNWRVETAEGSLPARDVVVALGPWSMDVLRPLGYRFPFAVKRGYHRHYAARGNASLSRPLVDTIFGYALAPMDKGIRLTTGIELADRDAPVTSVQVTRAEAHARALFPLGEPLEAEPWLGRRPCFPDSLPVIGPAPEHQGLWLNFGHAHLGFTLGPVGGRLLAQVMTGEAPLADPEPFSARRFG